MKRIGLRRRATEMNWTSRLLKLHGRKQGKGRDGFWKIVCTRSHSFRGGFSGGQGRYSRVESSRVAVARQIGEYKQAGTVSNLLLPFISRSESTLILLLHDHQSIDSIRFYLFYRYVFSGVIPPIFYGLKL